MSRLLLLLLSAASAHAQDLGGGWERTAVGSTDGSVPFVEMSRGNLEIGISQIIIRGFPERQVEVNLTGYRCNENLARFSTNMLLTPVDDPQVIIKLIASAVPKISEVIGARCRGATTTFNYADRTFEIAYTKLHAAFVSQMRDYVRAQQKVREPNE